MIKKLTVIVMLLTLVLLALPVSAAHYDNPQGYDRPQVNDRDAGRVKPIIYERTIVVTADGGEYSVGFADVIFPKGFIDRKQAPAVFNVKISAENGVAGIEFQPDTPSFNKDVTIKADAYFGLLYDETRGKNVLVQVRKQQFKVSHFSRYAFL